VEGKWEKGPLGIYILQRASEFLWSVRLLPGCVCTLCGRHRSGRHALYDIIILLLNWVGALYMRHTRIALAFAQRAGQRVLGGDIRIFGIFGIQDSGQRGYDTMSQCSGGRSEDDVDSSVYTQNLNEHHSTFPSSAQRKQFGSAECIRKYIIPSSDHQNCR
jgi:hypothetical protein